MITAWPYSADSAAPGSPGINARWTSSAKSGIGTALTAMSQIWFTMSHGILNEIYYRRPDQACTRDLGLIVTDGDGFFSEEKRHAEHRTFCMAHGVPAYQTVNVHPERYRITKCVIADPYRDVLLQQIVFEPLDGQYGRYRVFALLAPHLVNAGAGNTAWLGAYKGVPMLFAQGRGTALAFACTVPWRNASAGFVGHSDGWQILSQHGKLEPCWTRAENGNVALTGEIDFSQSREVTLALGFGVTPEEAAHRVRSSLNYGFENALRDFIAGWRQVLDNVHPLTLPPADDAPDLYRTSVAVMLSHEPYRFAGGIIASLSIPWGFAKGDDDLGGYHLVWPRDLAETAGGLIAAGQRFPARVVVAYLAAVQEADGHWPQNMWLDGTPYWGGVQLDECAFPILVLDMLLREKMLDAADADRFTEMVATAAGFVVRNGPVTRQDRWEEDAGYSPFSLAVTVSALLAAANFLEPRGFPQRTIRHLRETADWINDSIENWTYARGTKFAGESGVDGYYVRIGPVDLIDDRMPPDATTVIKNRPDGATRWPAADIVSPDALALVRFGLRSAHDPRIVNTVAVIDRLLKVDLPQGPVWRRYNQDGYGEHEDGYPFDGTGIGRAWPLLTGERAHYELAAGRADEARRLLGTLEGCACPTGLLPEQVWDADDIPERELFRGRATGSAMPLVWAHAEHAKLVRSLKDGRVFDMPPQTVQRYLVEKVTAPFVVWRFDRRRQTVAGKNLRIEVFDPAMIHWSSDQWQTTHDLNTQDTGLGVYSVDLPTADLAPGSTVLFTFFWRQAHRWEGADFKVEVVAVNEARK
jgi:glucoamylase